jgi:predicted ATPase/DNA-binding CsgD family transcriptional regulator
VRKSSTPDQIIVTDAPIVAREAEAERILSLLDTVVEGRSRMVLLSGEAGVGKTRLVYEVLARASERGIQSFVGRCFGEYAGVGFFPFTELLGAALANAPGEFQAEARSRWPELAYVVPELGAPRGVKTDETQLQVFRAAAGFVHALAKVNPFVLFLDDLHWADTTSLALLLYLGRHVDDTRVLILGTYCDTDVGRHHPLQGTLRELGRERLVEEVELLRLELAGTAALIKTRLGSESVADQLVTLVHQRAQGNPFFTEALLAALIEQGLLSRGAHDPLTTSVDEFKLPRSIRSVVGERVGRLPAEAQEMLILASVLGPEFDLDALVAACERPEVAVLKDLDTAIEARLLQERRHERGERFGFVHVLIQEVLYEELPAHRRRRLHLRVGEVLAQLRAEQPTAAAELARHFLEGGDTERAVTYATRAGDDAAGRYAHAEAVQHYEVAVGILREGTASGLLAEVQQRLASELYDLNRLPEALAAYESALRAFEQLGDGAGLASVHWGLGRLHDSRYDMVAAVHHLDEALRFWPSALEDAGLARLLVDTARTKAFSGNWVEAMQLAERGLAVAERLGNAVLLARALLGLAIAHDQEKDRLMIPLLDRAEGLARAAGDWRTLSRVYGHRGGRRFKIGEIEESLADHRRAIEFAQRSGESHRLGFAYQSLAFDCLDLGYWDEGRKAARAGLALDPHRLLNGSPGRADLAWMEGRHDEALDELRAFVSDARKRQDVQGVTVGLWRLADFELQLDRPSDAEPAAREAADLARSRWRSEVDTCMATLSETVACLDAQDVEAVLEEAERLIEELEKPVSRPQLLRARALLFLRRGDVTRSTAALLASAELARSQHALVQLGRTLMVLVKAARLQGDEALVAQFNAERVELVERIGPHVRGLAWARGTPSARREQRGRVRSADHAQPGPLSPREQEVAGLIAHGLTDRQVAERLVITEGTAGVHVGHILNKLGFHTRTEIARWAVEHGYGDALGSSD